MSMKVKAVFKGIGALTVLAAVLFVVLWSNNIVGLAACQLEGDIRKEQKVNSSWEVCGQVGKTMAAYVSYPQNGMDAVFSIYQNRPGFSFGYFFRGGGSVQRGICAYRLEGATERAFLSANQQQINRLELDNGQQKQVINLDSSKPFALVVPANSGTVTFYDVNGQPVEFFESTL